MRQIIFLAHGDFAQGLASAMRVIGVDASEFSFLSLAADDGVEEMEHRLEMSFRVLDSNKPVVIITDLPAGSTTQYAVKAMINNPKVHVICGCNLGLALAVALEPLDDHPEDQLRRIVKESQETIMYINDALCASR